MYHCFFIIAGSLKLIGPLFSTLDRNVINLNIIFQVSRVASLHVMFTWCLTNQQTDCTVSHWAVWEIKLRLHLVLSPVCFDLVWSLVCVSFIELFGKSKVNIFKVKLEVMVPNYSHRHCVSSSYLGDQIETQLSPAASSLVPSDKEMKGSMNIQLTLLIPLKFSLVAAIFSLQELSQGNSLD